MCIDNPDLKDELERIKEINEKLEYEIQENKRVHEDEVSMRLKFESKLNQLHSLYRDIETRYERACEDIEQLQTNNHSLTKLSDEQRGELAELNTIKIKLETDVEFKDSQIKFHLREAETRQRKINDQELQISKLLSQIDRHQFQINDLNEQVNAYEVQKDVASTTIAGLKHERFLLEEQCRDLKEEKEKYVEKYETSRAKFEDVRDKLQALQREEMSYQKLADNFDERVKQMSDENIELNTQVNNLEKQVAILTEQNEIYKSTNDELSSRNNEITVQIEELNSLKNKLIKDLDEANDKINSQVEQIGKKNGAMEKDRKEIERLNRRLMDMEQENDTLEIEKNSHQKTTVVQKKQLNEQLKTLSESLSVEKEAREKWIDRYEVEHKKFVALTTEDIQNKAKIKDLQSQLENANSAIAKHIENMEKFQGKYNQTLQKLHDTEGQLENTIRSLNSTKSLLNSIEEEHRAAVDLLRTEISSLKDTILELNSQKTEVCKKLVVLEQSHESNHKEIADLTHQVEKLKSELESINGLHEVLQKNHLEKCTLLENAEYDKIIAIEELKVQTEMYENSQMEVEDYLVILERLSKSLNYYKDLEDELKDVKNRLNHFELKENSKGGYSHFAQHRYIQTDNLGVDKAVTTEKFDELPDMNDISLVNTLTTSLGGMTSNKNKNLKNQGIKFVPSPINSSVDEIGKNNKLKSYLKSNKDKNRAILEEDSDLTRISYSTKNAMAPRGLKFSLRHSNMSPNNSKGHMYKRQKDMSRRKRKFKKAVKNNLVNESMNDSISSKKSQIEKEEQEMLKSVYQIIHHESRRPMTGQPVEIVTSETKYDDELRDSIIKGTFKF